MKKRKNENEHATGKSYRPERGAARHTLYNTCALDGATGASICIRFSRPDHVRPPRTAESRNSRPTLPRNRHRLRGKGRRSFFPCNVSQSRVVRLAVTSCEHVFDIRTDVNRNRYALRGEGRGSSAYFSDRGAELYMRAHVGIVYKKRSAITLPIIRLSSLFIFGEYTIYYCICFLIRLYVIFIPQYL